MLGAIIGDIVGSRFEWNNIKVKDFDLFTEECEMTDDSIMTLAVAKAIRDAESNPEILQKIIGPTLQSIGRIYPNCGYGSHFKKWLFSPRPKPYNSFGNGAAMRVSPCGFLANTLDEAIHLANIVTGITHNHPEGIRGAEATVTAIFLAKSGNNKSVIRKYIDAHYYKLDFVLDEIRQDYTFDVSCQGTVSQAIQAFMESENFEGAIRNAISIGGDSDTLAAITGGIAEAYYGIPDEIASRVVSFLDDFSLKILNSVGYDFNDIDKTGEVMMDIYGNPEKEEKMNLSEHLTTSLHNGFIDCNLTSLQKYNPRLLVNDHKRGMKVLTSIEKELMKCDEFYFSVAFITNSGVTALLDTLERLRKKNIKGYIVTSQYQNFTEPVALKRLLGFKNIELKIVTEGNFHAKGYIFKQKEYYSFIIGSSNLTQGALGYNKEWNVKLSSLENGGLMKNLLEEFWHTHKYATLVDGIWLEQYSTIYETISRAQKAVARRAEDPEKVIPLKKVYPNKMQKEALRSLEILRDQGKNKALLISATGTGKTYLSAFDVAKFQPQKFLFVVHRENIARAALRSYKAILGNDINAGLIAGSRRDYDKDFVFATIQSISKDEHLNKFPKDHFDYIVIDEVHRAGATTYQKVLGYFKPKFCLGMSATPERSDGNDIFKDFDYNIAYEIRLNRAMEEQMVTPFHYFGVSEIEVDGKLLDDKVDFNKLVCQERVERIVEASQFYGWDSGRVKGLIFCSRIEECHKLSEEFNKRGYDTIALDGSSSEELREKSIERLEQDDLENKLDYIFTVDIFNEGVDIPSINQIIMLRPTQSAIIFVQQLGRGLRVTEDKEFLTIIDFIGNYSNNYLIPIALFGDRTFNKDTIRKLMHNGSGVIPGCSTIHFDEITEKRIFEAIDRTNMSKKADLKADYQSLKAELGRIPMMEDFLNYGRRDPYAFVGYAGSYYNFLVQIGENEDASLTSSELKLLEFYSKEVLNAKRVDEAILLALLIGKGDAPLKELNAVLNENYKYEIDEKTAKGLVNVLNGSFLRDSDRGKYGIGENVFLDQSGNDIIFHMNDAHRSVLLKEGVHKYIDDSIRYCQLKYSQSYDSQKFRNGFLLYEKYGRKDACRILNWEKDEAAVIFGYKIKHSTCPIFVTYHKSDEISKSTNYDDGFINTKLFSWMTRNNLRLDSKEVVDIKRHTETGLRISLFVKKSDGEGTDFYYMGDVEPRDYISKEIYNDKGKKLPIVNIRFEMLDEVEEGIYDYIVGHQSDSPFEEIAI